MAALLRFFGHKPGFVWSPALDLRDPRIWITLIPFSTN